MNKDAKIAKKSKKERILDHKAKKELHEDLYGFETKANQIREYIENTQNGTIGVYGKWGSGKTTFKNFIIQKIEKNTLSTIYPIEFNAWKYEQQGGILFPLLNRLVKEAGFENTKIKKAFFVLGISFADVLLKHLSKGVVSLQDIKDYDELSNEYLNKYSEYVDQINDIENDFQDIIDGITQKTEKQTVSIFIDELDRCNPENAIKLLESIKNFFDVERCQFIIFVDDEILASYVDKKYEGTRMNGQLYLDKIVNVKFRVPLIPQHEIEILFKDFSVDVELLDFSPRLQNPRTIARIYEKTSMWNERSESYKDPVPKVVSDKPEDERRVRIFLVVLLFECFAEIFLALNRMDGDTWNKLQSALMAYGKDSSTRYIDQVRNISDFDSEEVSFLLNFIGYFKSKNEFMAYVEFLKEIQVL